jgi:hypothetical protein
MNSKRRKTEADGEVDAEDGAVDQGLSLFTCQFVPVLNIT